MTEISEESAWVPVGFHFGADHAGRTWRFAGSRADLRLIPVLLRGVARGPGTGLSLGSGELTLGVWERPGIDDQGVYGPSEALAALAGDIDVLLDARDQPEFRLRTEFAADAEYALHFTVDDEVSGAYYAAPESSEPEVPLPDLPPLTFSFIGLDDELKSEGRAHVDEGAVFLEFEIREEDDDIRLPEVYETSLPFADLASVEMKRSIFGPVVTIRAKRMKAVEHVPSSKAGRLKLRFKRKDAADVERMVALFETLLG